MINRITVTSRNSTPEFLLPKVPSAAKRSVVTGNSDSGTETSDSSDDKSNYETLKCACCPYRTNELSFYIFHLKSVHSTETLQCINCCINFSVDNFQRHLVKCKGTFACDMCNASFAQKSYLQRHITRVHSRRTINNSFICDICGQNLSTNNNLKQHRLIHSVVSQYVCPYCGKGFVQKIHYNTHLDSKHSKLELVETTKPFQCCLCGEHFIFQTSLQQHLNSCAFKKEKKFSCFQCDKSFAYPSELQRHQSTHLSRLQRQYQCDQCNKSFNRLYEFVTHQFFHNNISAFKCPICDKLLSHLSYLKLHYQRHFQCHMQASSSHSSSSSSSTTTCFTSTTSNNKYSSSSDCYSSSSSSSSSVESNDKKQVLSGINQLDNLMDSDEDFFIDNNTNLNNQDNNIFIDRFIEEVWDRFQPCLDEENQQAISLDELKLDLWEEFNTE